MSDATDWLVIGKFGRPHGIKGLITVLSFTEPRENILDYTHWHIPLGDQWQPLSVLDVKVGHKSILAKIEGYSEREDVARLTNLEIAVKREQLSELGPDEFYWHQLVGLSVINQQNITLGVVNEIVATGSNDVLVVLGEKRHLVPYLPGDVIIDVSLAQGIITVDWDANF